MNPPVLAFFSSRIGSGTTSLVYHLARILADCGYRVLAADHAKPANQSSD